MTTPTARAQTRSLLLPGRVMAQIRGFDEMGGTDDFHEDMLAFVLRCAQPMETYFRTQVCSCVPLVDVRISGLQEVQPPTFISDAGLISMVDFLS